MIILFLFGMPFHVPTHGYNYIRDSYINKPDIALERWFTRLSWAGLGCLVVGTLLQILALRPPRTK